MNKLRYLALAGVAAICFTVATPRIDAQVSISIGVAPECPYGYYDASPYGCAPSGYYGPEWFTGGVFIGAGPWFRGGDSFRGQVNNNYHPANGYRGATPQRGEKAEPSKHAENAAHFKGNEVRDGRGHTGGENKR